MNQYRDIRYDTIYRAIASNNLTVWPRSCEVKNNAYNQNDSFSLQKSGRQIKSTNSRVNSARLIDTFFIFVMFFNRARYSKRLCFVVRHCLQMSVCMVHCLWVYSVYDVSSKQSFMKLDQWINELETHSTKHDIVTMLVGNKIDKVNTYLDFVPLFAISAAAYVVKNKWKE